MNPDIAIVNGLILTMEKASPVIENGSVIVKNQRIEAVGRVESVGVKKGTLVIDASGTIVMPGLVNCHTHLPMSLFRGLADDLPLDVWLNEHMFPAEASRINPKTAKKWALHSAKELLLSGTTTCCDGYFYEDQVAEAVLESGMRAILGQGVIDFPAPGVPESSENVTQAAAFAGKWLNRSSRIEPSIFCHSPYTCSKKTLVEAKAAASDMGLLFQIHLAETKNEQAMIEGAEGRTPVAYLDSIGLLDERSLLVHCVWLNETDQIIIKERGASVAHCPESNMKLASGIAPVPGMLELGIPLGLGTDGSASNNNLDLFCEMNSAATLQKLANSDPAVMGAEETVALATIKGAQALGLDDEIGSIKPGKRADIILINAWQPHLVPMGNPFAAVAHGVKGGDVTDVMVDGKFLVRHGQLTR